MEHERRTKSIKQWVIENTGAAVILIVFIFSWIVWISKIPAMSEQLNKDIGPRVVNLEKTNAVFIEKLDNIDKTLTRIERIMDKNR
jgi:hypothetical protein